MKTIKQKQRILSKALSRMRKNKDLPQDLITLLGQTAELQLSEQQNVSVRLPEQADLQELQDRVIHGGSFFTPETFPIDKNHVLSMLHRIMELIKNSAEELPESMVTAVSMIEQALESKEIILEKAIIECMSGGGPITEKWAKLTPEAPSALRFLILASLEPSLNKAANLIEENEILHKTGTAIRKSGTCPVCGNLPHIQELREKEGFKVAICSTCRHEYRIKRLSCPVCDNTDTEKLKSFTVEEEPGFRVEACDNCKTYCKTIDFRELDRDAFPAMDDLESVALDYIAAGEGYSRPAPSAWGI